MTNLIVLVEGHSEESFVNNLLCPHLMGFNVFPQAIRVETKRGGQRGGLVSYVKAKDDLVRLIKNKPKDFYFTTMFDLYALPNNFPNYQQVQHLQYTQKVSELETSFFNDIAVQFPNSQNYFIPYIQLHEFEALLLSEPSSFDCYYINRNTQIQNLSEMVKSYNSPEEINQGKETAPSKRIIREFPSYEKEKPTASTEIALKIGLSTMRNKCQHFNDWLTKLEQLR